MIEKFIIVFTKKSERKLDKLILENCPTSLSLSRTKIQDLIKRKMIFDPQKRDPLTLKTKTNDLEQVILYIDNHHQIHFGIETKSEEEQKLSRGKDPRKQSNVDLSEFKSTESSLIHAGSHDSKGFDAVSSLTSNTESEELSAHSSQLNLKKNQSKGL